MKGGGKGENLPQRQTNADWRDKYIFLLGSWILCRFFENSLAHHLPTTVCISFGSTRDSSTAIVASVVVCFRTLQRRPSVKPNTLRRPADAKKHLFVEFALSKTRGTGGAAVNRPTTRSLRSQLTPAPSSSKIQLSCSSAPACPFVSFFLPAYCDVTHEVYIYTHTHLHHVEEASTLPTLPSVLLPYLLHPALDSAQLRLKPTAMNTSITPQRDSQQRKNVTKREEEAIGESLTACFGRCLGLNSNEGLAFCSIVFRSSANECGRFLSRRMNVDISLPANMSI